MSKRKRKQEARLKVADLKTVSPGWLCRLARQQDSMQGRPSLLLQQPLRHVVSVLAPLLTCLSLLWASCTGLLNLLHGLSWPGPG